MQGRGTILFERHHGRRSGFVRVEESVETEQVVDVMMNKWNLSPPGLLLSVHGSAANFDLPAGQHASLRHGIVSAIQTTDAWVMTGGLDSGVQRFVGETLAQFAYKCTVPLIGVAAWNTVNRRDKLVCGPGKKVHYAQDDANSAVEAGLEPNHTHFVFVDTKAGGWGSQHQFVARFEEELARRYNCPKVMLLVQGGPNALDILIETLEEGVVVVVAAYSGQLSSALFHYATTGKVPQGYESDAAAFEQIRRLNAAEAARCQARGVPDATQHTSDEEDEESAARKWPLLVFYAPRGIGSDSVEDVSEYILRAVWRQADSTKRVELAVMWDRSDLLKRVLSDLPMWKAGREDLLNLALQLALETRRSHMVREALHQGANVKAVELRKLMRMLQSPATAKYQLFHHSSKISMAKSADAEDSESLTLGSRGGGVLRASRGEALADGSGVEASALLSRGAERSDDSKARRTSEVIPQRLPRPSVFVLMANKLEASVQGDEAAGYPYPLDELEYITSPEDGFYPFEVWKVLAELLPQLRKHWHHRVGTFKSKAVARNSQVADAQERYGDIRRASLVPLGKDTPSPVRCLDVYLWAVLLGDTELALVLLDKCQEPLRAAFMGAHLCVGMAARLPTDAAELEEAAARHEMFALRVLDLCEEQAAARLLLTSPSYHWDKNILQLADAMEMKQFVAHRMVQNLCDKMMEGHIDSNFMETPCRAALPAQYSSNPRPLGLLLHALCPLPHVGTQQVRSEFAESAPRVSDFYRIPLVKTSLRTVCFLGYVLLFSYVSMKPQLDEDFAVHATHTFMDDVDTLAADVSTLATDIKDPSMSGQRLGIETSLFRSGAAAAAAAAAPRIGSAAREAGRRLTAASEAAGRQLRAKGSRGSKGAPGEIPGLPEAERSAIVGRIGWPEVVLAVWTLSLILDEWHQYAMKPSTFELDLWNKYDYVWLSLVCLSLAFRMSEKTAGLLSSDAAHLASDLPLAEIGHELHAIVNILVWLRLLQNFSSNRGVGVLIIMIIEMVKDMLLWFMLSAIFLCGFTVTFISISQASDPFEWIGGPVALPAWAMYGEFDLQSVTSWDKTSLRMGAGMLWVYVLISNVLLVNLLIAMMSDTFSNVKVNADMEWKYDRLSYVLEAVERMYPIPPPFSLPVLLYRITASFLFKTSWEAKLSSAFDGAGTGKPDGWEIGGRLWGQKKQRQDVAKKALRVYRRTEEEADTSSTGRRLERVETRVDDILKTLEDLRHKERDQHFTFHAAAEIKAQPLPLEA